MNIANLLRMMVCALVLFPMGSGGQARLDLLHKVAPRFVRTDLSGRRVDLRQYRGKVVLLNFWATWCAPCQAELPRFGVWQKEYGEQGLVVLAVSMDDDVGPVRKAVRRLQLDFPVMMGDAKLGSAYGGVLGLPVTYLIDRDGRIVARFKGETDPVRMEDQVRKLIHSQ